MARRSQTAETEAVAKTALQLELEKIEKELGIGTVITSNQKQEKVDVISTGSYKLDRATGIWGLPRGKIVEVMGWESSGKSTIVQQTIGNAQKQGLRALLIDGENSLDATYAKALGVDVDTLLYEQLDEGGGERCYNVAERLIRTGEIGIAVIDSQTSLLPKKVIEGEVGDSALGLQARLMSTAVPKIMTAAGKANCLVIFINQFREKIGVMFGSPETTNGGNALKFYSHMRIRVSKSVLKGAGKDDEPYGNKTTCKVIKNKLAIPFKEAEFVINYGTGVDRDLEILDLATETGIIKLSGSWYSYQDNNIGQGSENIISMFKDNPDFRQEIETQVITKLKS